MNINREELAWAAGFFDGEGCAHCSIRSELLLAIGQTDIRPLERFNAALGNVGKINKRRDDRPTRKPAWALYIHGLTDVEVAVALLWNWLSEPKREQIIRAFKKAIPEYQKRYLSSRRRLTKAELKLKVVADAENDRIWAIIDKMELEEEEC